MRLFLLIMLFLNLNLSLIKAQKIVVEKIHFMPGTNESYLNKDFDDTTWQPIQAATPIENSGYPDFDGFGWYRIHFSAENIDPDEWYYLSIGRIDDVDITYLNGFEIGRTGLFPPNFSTAYHVFREYIIQGSQLNNENNVLAIRMFDERLLGGWLEGRLELKRMETPAQVFLPILGTWKFKTGDNLAYANQKYNDENWDSLRAEMSWENQGYPDYDGFAWYRKKIQIPKFIQDGNYELNLGFIDDADQVYINGNQIGQTGTFTETEAFYDDLNYKIKRIYPIPQNLMNSDSDWVIAIRVFDGFNEGGLIGGHIVIQKKLDSTNQRITILNWFKELLRWIINYLKSIL